MSEEEKRRMSEARKRANAKFENKAYDKILVRVEAGKKEEIKAHAAQYQLEVGEIGKPGYAPKGSINGFIARAINEAMERDNASDTLTDESYCGENLIDESLTKHVDEYLQSAVLLDSEGNRKKMTLHDLVNTALFVYLWDHGIVQGKMSNKEGYVSRCLYLAARYLEHAIVEHSAYLTDSDKTNLNKCADQFHKIWRKYNVRSEKE